MHNRGLPGEPIGQNVTLAAPAILKGIEKRMPDEVNKFPDPLFSAGAFSHKPDQLMPNFTNGSTSRETYTMATTLLKTPT